MRFMETGIVDARVIEPSPHQDERGRFVRAWCVREFAEHGLDFLPVQANLGFSKTQWDRPGHALPDGAGD